VNASQLVTIIGRQGLWRAQNGLQVAVTVTDARTCFGRDDYLIAPQTGSGTVWVDAQSVTLNGEGQ
jgi:hypothetical protein